MRVELALSYSAKGLSPILRAGNDSCALCEAESSESSLLQLCKKRLISRGQLALLRLLCLNDGADSCKTERHHANARSSTGAGV